MSKKEKILLGLILFFLFTLFFPRPVILTIIAPVALVLFSLAFSSFKEKWQMLKQRRYLQGMLLFFAVILTSVFLSSDLDKALNFLDPRLALFYLPLTVGTLQLRKEFRDNVLLSFALLTVAMCALCLGYGSYNAWHFNNKDYLYNDALTEILGQQSIYIALLTNLSIFIFAYFILFKKISYKGLLSIKMLFLYIVSYFLASRIMMAVLVITTLGFCFYFIVHKKRMLEGAALILALTISIFLVSKFSPQTLNRFKELNFTQFDYGNLGKESHFSAEATAAEWNGANFRLAAWRCGWELFQQNPVFGVHIGDKKDRLFEVYAQKKFLFAIETNKNVHNNYLDILYSMGLIGLLVFITGWIALPAIAAWKNKDSLAMLIILTFAAAWITEIYFDRNLGGMLTGFFISFLLTYIKNGRQS